MKSPFRSFASLVAGAWLFALCSSGAFAAPTLSLSLGERIGGLLPLTVVATDFSDLYAYQFSLIFNPGLVQAVSVSEGSFLADGGATFFDGGTIDNAAGTISFIFETLLGPTAGVSGSGPLAVIDLQLVSPGLATFSLTDVLMLDSNLNEITTQVESLTAQVPEPGLPALLIMGALAFLLVNGKRGIPRMFGLRN